MKEYLVGLKEGIAQGLGEYKDALWVTTPEGAVFWSSIAICTATTVAGERFEQVRDVRDLSFTFTSLWVFKHSLARLAQSLAHNAESAQIAPSISEGSMAQLAPPKAG